MEKLEHRQTIHSMDLRKVYENPLSLTKMLTATEFNILFVLLHNPTALPVRQILRKIVLNYLDYLILGEKRLIEKHKQSDRKKMLRNLQEIKASVKPEQQASYINKHLRDIPEPTPPTLPTYRRVESSLNNLINLGLVAVRPLVGQKEKALYYVEPEFFRSFDRVRMKLKKETSSGQEKLLYFGEVRLLDRVV